MNLYSGETMRYIFNCAFSTELKGSHRSGAHRTKRVASVCSLLLL
jgi:hypothetical protein